MNYTSSERQSEYKTNKIVGIGGFLFMLSFQSLPFLVQVCQPSGDGFKRLYFLQYMPKAADC